MTTRHPNGVILESITGGDRFVEDETLTALVTNSGRYPLGEFFSPGDAFAQVGSAFHGRTLFNPSHVAFYRNDRFRTAVSSPVTGVFFRQAARGAPALISWMTHLHESAIGGH